MTTPTSLRSLAYRERLQIFDLEWSEVDHPRDEAGRWVTSDGGVEHWVGAGTPTEPPRTFKGDEGYDWHERPEMEAYVTELPDEDVQAITSYASFGYGDINRHLRGEFTPNIVNETVRAATPEEIATFKYPPMGHGQHASDYDERDPLNKVDDGRIVHHFHYEGGYKPDAPEENAKNRVDTYTIEKAGPDEKYVKQMVAKTDRINESIRERGYELPEAIKVNRAAYIPGMSYDDVKALEGKVIEEKGFTSTMVGDPGHRLDGYVTGGKSESLYKRHGKIYEHQDEVGAPVRISIILPEGTKVAPVEPMRRVDYKYPRKQDPSVFEHPEWLEGGKLKAEDFTIPDLQAKPSVKTDRLHDKTQRSEAEILLGSGAQFRIKSVRRGPTRIISSDPEMKPIDVIDVQMEYVGGGSSEAGRTKTHLRHDLGGPGSGNFGHAGRPGEIGGSAEGAGRSPIDEKHHAFMALLKEAEQQESHVDVLRTELNDAWKTWADEIANRKKPLKPDGAAAKKLDSYKQAKALEDQFHARYESAMGRERALTAQAREMLKVPHEDRSKVTFTDDPDTALHPAVASGAKRALLMLRQFDGSGAFVPLKFPAEKVAQFREVFGDKTPLEQNADGTFSIPATLRLARSESGRAHASLGAVHLTGGAQLEGQVFHEVAHHIEMNSHAVLQAAVALRDTLADTPREVYKLQTISPSLGADEVALRGKFPDPYAGKVYPDDVATEIISTGVESYMKDPVRFARERPEHFKLVFDVLHGKYRSRSGLAWSRKT